MNNKALGRAGDRRRRLRRMQSLRPPGSRPKLTFSYLPSTDSTRTQTAPCVPATRCLLRQAATAPIFCAPTNPQMWSSQARPPANVRRFRGRFIGCFKLNGYESLSRDQPLPLRKHYRPAKTVRPPPSYSSRAFTVAAEVGGPDQVAK